MTETNQEQLACSLPEQEFQKRVRVDISDLIEKAKKISEIEAGYELTFPADDETLSAVSAFILEERKCCSFFEFNLRIPANFADTNLIITGPDRVKEFVGRLFETKNESMKSAE